MTETAPVAWLDPTRTLEERVTAFGADLSATEKVSVALGDRSPFETRGLPAIDYVDAGTGLRGVVGATAFPAGIALAATFDAELAGRYGAAVGAEVRAAGFPVLLGPSLDLARDPRAGRLPEALGEDPYLCGLLGAAHVRGVQGNHVISQLKHFVAYNGEEARTGYGLPDRGDAVDCLIPTGMLQDVYLLPFHAAVVAGAWSMMGSYTASTVSMSASPTRCWRSRATNGAGKGSTARTFFSRCVTMPRRPLLASTCLRSAVQRAEQLR